MPSKFRQLPMDRRALCSPRPHLVDIGHLLDKVLEPAFRPHRFALPQSHSVSPVISASRLVFYRCEEQCNVQDTNQYKTNEAVLLFAVFGIGRFFSLTGLQKSADGGLSIGYHALNLTSLEIAAVLGVLGRVILLSGLQDTEQLSGAGIVRARAEKSVDGIANAGCHVVKLTSLKATTILGGVGAGILGIRVFLSGLEKTTKKATGLLAVLRGILGGVGAGILGIRVFLSGLEKTTKEATGLLGVLRGGSFTAVFLTGLEKATGKAIRLALSAPPLRVLPTTPWTDEVAMSVRIGAAWTAAARRAQALRNFIFADEGRKRNKTDQKLMQDPIMKEDGGVISLSPKTMINDVAKKKNGDPSTDNLTTYVIVRDWGWMPRGLSRASKLRAEYIGRHPDIFPLS
ncbi:hypothetical protein L249_0845, partial [Ophiocordyceps polyrhachis-furcata BCC 54312]